MTNAFDFKQYGHAIKIEKTMGSSGLCELLEEKRKEMEECLFHYIESTPLRHSRIYRRGKNRCVRCGLKK